MGSFTGRRFAPLRHSRKPRFYLPVHRDVPGDFGYDFQVLDLPLPQPHLALRSCHLPQHERVGDKGLGVGGWGLGVGDALPFQALIATNKNRRIASALRSHIPNPQPLTPSFPYFTGWQNSGDKLKIVVPTGAAPL